MHWLVVERVEAFRRPLVDFAQGNFDARLPVPRTADEVGELARAFNEAGAEVREHLAAVERRDRMLRSFLAKAGSAVAEFLHGRRDDPARWLPASYPSFRLKRALRFLFDHFQSDWACNLLLATRPMRAAASLVYFHRRGLVEPGRE